MYIKEKPMAFTITSMSSLLKHTPNALKPTLEPIIKDMEVGGFFADDTRVSPGKNWTIKVSKTNYDVIIKRLKPFKPIKKTISGKSTCDVEVAGHRLRFQETGKKSVGAADAQSTRKQELASLWIIRRALNDNVRYSTYKDIVKDPKWKELSEIYPEIDDVWLKGLHAMAKTMLHEYSNTKFTEYNRDGGFMDFISSLIRTKYGISQKDTWNPADIWLIQNQSAREKELDKAAVGTSPKIQELNEVMKKQFKKRQVVGVSLKKISGKEAIWEEVNVDDVMFKGTDYNFEVQLARCKLDSKVDGTFTSSDTVVAIGDGEPKYKFQIRQNSKGYNNQKFEPSMKGAGAARLGKVPQEMLRPMLRNDYGFTFTNSWRDYPQTVGEFMKDFNSYWKMFTIIYPHVETNIKKTKKDFENAFLKSWSSDDDTHGVTNSKLMQLDFLSQLFSLKKEKREDLLTDMLFLGMKKGAKFGPFGKLY
jgi:hypothetical protein